MSALSTERRTSWLPLTAFVLAVCLTVTSTLVAFWWEPIDTRFITAADDAGWDTSLLLPHEELLSIVIRGAVLLSVALSGLTFVALLRSRRATV